MAQKEKTKEESTKEIKPLYKRITELETVATARDKAEQAAKEACIYAESIIETMREILIVLSKDLRVISANGSFYQTFKVTPEETKGRFIYDLGNRQWDIPKLRQLLEEILPKNNFFENYEIEHRFENIGIKTMLLNARRLDSMQMILLVIEDISERKRAEDALRISERKIRAIFDQTFQFIGMLGVDGRIIEVNRTAMQFAGISESDCLGKPFWDTPWWTHSSEMQNKLREAVKKAANGEVVCFEATHPAADGSIHYVDFSLKPVRDKNGKAVFLISEGRDITERKRLEGELRCADELRIATEIKSKFTSMVSHELRSPLAAIKEGINLVLEGLVGSITDEQRDLLDTAKKNTDRLGRLINDVLDFQKIDSGKMDFDIRENDINEVAREASKEMSPLAGKKGLNLVVDVDDDLPKIRFDKDKIIQVITNLLNNAINFTEKGSISICTKRENNAVHVMVKDTGQGIGSEDIERLFQAFGQLDARRDKKKGGTGLGLAISKEIILAHRGKIWADSETGKGTVLHFTLPLKERRG